MSDIKPYKLYKSSNPNKKYDVYVVNPTTKKINKVSFGAAGMEDYTIHKDKERRMRYRQRHANDKINDPTRAGFWSWHVLWGASSSLNAAFKSARKYALDKL